MFEKFQDLAQKIQNRLPIGKSITASLISEVTKKNIKLINPSLHERIVAVSYKDGRVKISTSSSTSRNEIYYIKHQLINTINEELGKPYVVDIFCSHTDNPDQFGQ